MFQIARTSIALATAATALTFVACDEAALPITQTVEGARFSYTIPAGTEAEKVFELERTVAAKDIQAQLAALGIDNVVLESVEVSRLDIELNNADVLDPANASFVSLADIEKFDVSFDEFNAANEVIGALALATLQPGDYDITEVAAGLQVITGINVLRFLERQEVTARASIELKEPVTLTEDLTIDIEIDYEVRAKVQSGQ